MTIFEAMILISVIFEICMLFLALIIYESYPFDSDIPRTYWQSFLYAHKIGIWVLLSIFGIMFLGKFLIH